MKIQRYKSLFLALFLLSSAAHANEVIYLAEVSLDDAVKQVIDGNRLLDAETREIENRKIHVIKVLTEDGRVQNLKVDAETGERLAKSKK